MSNKPSKREKMQRLVALLMVIFLLVSVFATVIFYLAAPVFAADGTDQTDTGSNSSEPPADLPGIGDTDETDPEDTTSDTSSDTDDTSVDTDNTPNDTDNAESTDTSAPADIEDPEEDVPPPDPNQKLMRIGLMYGTGITVGFETVAKYGFTVNKVNRTGDLTCEPLWQTDITKVSCIVDANLSKSGMTYSKTSDPSKAVVGAYHVEITTDLEGADVKVLTELLDATLEGISLYTFPAYINGEFRIRAGHFSTLEAANVHAELVAATLEGLPVTVAGPSATGVTLIDPLTDKILFEYDCGDVTALGLTAKPSPEGEIAYLVTPAKKSYDGTFMFRRYTTSEVDGVSLTNILPLEQYLKGVVSYEISASWPLEAQKAFAIAARSFTLCGARHESAYGFDLCNSQHCQAYGGMTKVTSTVEQAVAETKGLVMTYNNTIVRAYYSAVAGGVTVSSYDAWGFQHIPYLVAIETPWEIYTNHTYGTWTSEVSPTELCSYLRSKGYNLSGAVKSITIDKLAENSTYVRDLTITDTNGKKVTIKASENVRTALAKYVHSANFVVGKGSVEADQTQFVSVSLDKVKAHTSAGAVSTAGTENVSVITASGAQTTALSGATVLSAHGNIKLGGTTSVSEKVTVSAKNPENFIFVGKGQGHGVGISQVGLRDLAKLGYKAPEILAKYLTGIEIVDWKTVLK